MPPCRRQVKIDMRVDLWPARGTCGVSGDNSAATAKWRWTCSHVADAAPEWPALLAATTTATPMLRADPSCPTVARRTSGDPPPCCVAAATAAPSDAELAKRTGEAAGSRNASHQWRHSAGPRATPRTTSCASVSPCCRCPALAAGQGCRCRRSAHSGCIDNARTSLSRRSRLGTHRATRSSEGSRAQLRWAAVSLVAGAEVWLVRKCLPSTDRDVGALRL